MSTQAGLFSSRFGRVMVGMAVCLVLLSVVLALYGEGLNRPSPRESDTYSRSAIGHRALFDFARKMGYQPTRLTALQHQLADAPIFFMEPKPKVRHLGVEYQLQDTLQRRYQKGLSSVLVLPKWRLRKKNGKQWAESRSANAIQAWLFDLLPQLAPRLRLQRLLGANDSAQVSAQTSQTLRVPLHRLKNSPQRASQAPRKIEVKLLLPQRFMLLSKGAKSTKSAWTGKANPTQKPRQRSNARALRELLAPKSKPPRRTNAANGGLAHARIQVILGAGRHAYVLRISAPGPRSTGTDLGTDAPARRGVLWLVSDPDLMHNFNLHRGQHALLWHDLFGRLGSKRLLFDECYHGHVKSFSLAAEMGRFPHILFVLQGLLLLALFGWHGARRFGVHQTIEARQGRGPQEIIDITAWVLVCGQRIEQVAAAYVERVLQDTAATLQIKGTLDPQIARQLDQMAKRKGIEPQADMLLSWLDMTRRKLKQKPKDALRLAYKAWQFRQAMLARRHKTTMT